MKDDRQEPYRAAVDIPSLAVTWKERWQRYYAIYFVAALLVVVDVGVEAHRIGETRRADQAEQAMRDAVNQTKGVLEITRRLEDEVLEKRARFCPNGGTVTLQSLSVKPAMTRYLPYESWYEGSWHCIPLP